MVQWFSGSDSVAQCSLSLPRWHWHTDLALTISDVMTVSLRFLVLFLSIPLMTLRNKDRMTLLNDRRFGLGRISLV
jgi:hypothetical protein